MSEEFTKQDDRAANTAAGGRSSRCSERKAEAASWCADGSHRGSRACGYRVLRVVDFPVRPGKRPYCDDFRQARCRRGIVVERRIRPAGGRARRRRSRRGGAGSHSKRMVAAPLRRVLLRDAAKSQGASSASAASNGSSAGAKAKGNKISVSITVDGSAGGAGSASATNHASRGVELPMTPLSRRG